MFRFVERCHYGFLWKLLSKKWGILKHKGHFYCWFMGFPPSLWMWNVVFNNFCESQSETTFPKICTTVICIDSQKPKAWFIAQRPRCIFDKISQMSHFTWMTKAGFSGTRQNYHRPQMDHQNSFRNVPVSINAIFEQPTKPPGIGCLDDFIQLALSGAKEHFVLLIDRNG